MDRTCSCNFWKMETTRDSNRGPHFRNGECLSIGTTSNRFNNTIPIPVNATLSFANCDIGSHLQEKCSASGLSSTLYQGRKIRLIVLGTAKNFIVTDR